MNQKELKRILYEMRSLVDELESAVLADPSNYLYLTLIMMMW